jgi:polyhydroxyalkanoate synthase subunit PhaC
MILRVLPGAIEHAGSWWPDWAAWNAEQSGPKVPARRPGEGRVTPIEDVPGSYARVRAG